MFRSLAITPLLTLSLVLPTTAQQIDPKAREAAEGIVQSYNKAGQAKDAATLANVYTQDAILVMPDVGPLIGRAAIENYFKNAFQGFTLDAAKLENAQTINN